MKRVVVTGMGIISSLGNNKEEVNQSLRDSTSGISVCEEYREMGFRSHLAGGLKIDPKELIDRKTYRFMGDAAAYCYLAMKEAISDAKLTPEQVSNERTGLIVGSGGASNANVVESADLMRQSGVKKVGPYRVTRAMGSTTSACLATPFEIKGRSFSISSACSTSAHCIGTAYEQIQMGLQDVMFAGGGEELHWSMSVLFDAMGALSTQYNDRPTQASRAFDEDRDGFVISGGGGMLVLESLEHAQARGAKIYAEIVGYGANSDGFSMVRPSGEGAVRCMKSALENIDGPIDYLNTHGTSTGEGDVKEIAAINQVREIHEIRNVSSTKSLSGHSLGAAGVHEAIYSLLMMEHGYIPPSANIENLMPEAGDCPIVREYKEMPVKRAMSNSFGFGGVNVSLVFRRD